jgi:hypothetical protein
MSLPSAETDHEGAGLDLLISQFRGKPVTEGFLSVFLRRVQDLEDVLWDVIDLRDLETAENAQLESLGAIVGERRLGRSDSDYRLAIRLRVRVNRSKGRSVDVIDVATLAADGAEVTYLEYHVFQFHVGIYGQTGENYIARLLSETRAAASYGVLTASSLSLDALLAFDDDVTPLVGIETFSDEVSAEGLVAASAYALPGDYSGISLVGADVTLFSEDGEALMAEDGLYLEM